MAPSVPEASRRLLLGWLASALLTGVLLALVFLPPFVGPELRGSLMSAFHLVCHQLPGRSFQHAGVPLAVCHRCLGIYAGLFAGALLFPALLRHDARLWRRSQPILLGSLVPMGVDWTVDVAGLWMNTPFSRLATGLVFGIAAGYFVTRAFAHLASPARFAPVPGRA